MASRTDLAIFATGYNAAADPGDSGGLFVPLAQRLADGSVGATLCLPWSTDVSYSEGTGHYSSFQTSMQHGLQSRSMLLGNETVSLGDLATSILSGKQMPLSVDIDEMTRNAAGNLRIAFRLGQQTQRQIARILLGYNHIVDIDTGELEVIVNRLRTDWNAIQNSSLATSAFVMAPIGAKVGTAYPCMRSVFPKSSGARRAITWYCQENELMQERSYLRTMVPLYFYLSGVMNWKGAVLRKYANFLSLIQSFHLQRFKNYGKSLSSKELSEMLHLFMPYQLRPGLLDLPHTNDRARMIAWMAGLLLGTQTMSKEGVGSMIAPTNWVSLPDKYAPAPETIKDFFNGEAKPYSEGAGESCTLMKPIMGPITGVDLFRGVSRSNKMFPFSFSRGVHINWAPAMQNSDVLIPAEEGHTDEYMAFGFENRGKVVYLNPEVTSDATPILRIIDEVPRPEVPEATDNLDPVSLLCNFLVAGRSNWKADTLIFRHTLSIGEVVYSASLNTRLGKTPLGRGGRAGPLQQWRGEAEIGIDDSTSRLKDFTDHEAEGK